jgi:O-acetyl-ADP-ribose deacetylase
VITGGGRLASKYVIHTVGPRYRDGSRGEADTLASAYRESIRVADDHGIQSLAFPSVSTGIYAYPLEEAAAVAISAVLDALPTTIHVKQVRFVLFDSATLQAYVAAAGRISESNSTYIIEKRT